MLGAETSRSSRNTRYPFFTSAAAKLHAIVVFPVPPLYEWKAMHLAIVLKLCHMYLGIATRLLEKHKNQNVN